MADSDGEFVADDLSSDDLADHQVTRSRRHGGSGDSGDDGGHHHQQQHQGGGGVGGAAAAAAARRAARRKKKARDEQAAWETVKRSWDAVGEGDDGRVTGLEFLEAEKRRRLLRDTTPLQRGIIRHLVLVIDMSFAMAAKDYIPNYFRVAMALAAEFVREFFEQNPISQLGIVGMRDGVAVRISDLSGNPAEHIDRLKEWEAVEPLGNPSLQNALEMCRAALFHAPSHGTREVLIIFGALLSSDPGDIHDTITALISDRIQVSIVGLAAQVAICSDICARTNAGDEAAYAVALNDTHFRDLLLAVTTPPVSSATAAQTASLLMMGFPSRTLDPDGVSLCACHSRPVREGYPCTRCGSKVCRLPAECPSCGLVLILSTHLARSYHHLFPLRNWVEVPWSAASPSAACFACLTPFPDPPATTTAGGSGAKGKGLLLAPPTAVTREDKIKGVSESGRYACEVCGNHFCIDCDVYAHEVVHNCPGCQSRVVVTADDNDETGAHLNGNGETNGTAMVID